MHVVFPGIHTITDENVTSYISKTFSDYNTTLMKSIMSRGDI